MFDLVNIILAVIAVILVIVAFVVYAMVDVGARSERESDDAG